MAESVGKKQERFARALSELIRLLNQAGYEVRLREVWRTPQQAKWNAEQGLGIARSLHTIGLAADLYISRDGQMVPQTRDDYRIVGNVWKSLGADHAWGGDFQRLADIYHVSIMHEGVR